MVSRIILFYKSFFWDLIYLIYFNYISTKERAGIYFLFSKLFLRDPELSHIFPLNLHKGECWHLFCWFYELFYMVLVLSHIFQFNLYKGENICLLLILHMVYLYMSVYHLKEECWQCWIVNFHLISTKETFVRQRRS